ncbi:hypothetical protein KM043_010872 [Ampulex compressa]|nr:hypothetical protein KM043_010872 [Ampulex compressa]
MKYNHQIVDVLSTGSDKPKAFWHGVETDPTGKEAFVSQYVGALQTRFFEQPVGALGEEVEVEVEEEVEEGARKAARALGEAR